jgi:hypothetical protein
MTRRHAVAALTMVAMLAGFPALRLDTASGDDHPRLSDAWFTKRVPVVGRDLRRGNLPQKETQFDSSQDEQVVFLVLLNGLQGAKLRVELKSPTGRIRTGEWTIDDILGTGEWRFATYRWPMNTVESAPGEYLVALSIDGKPAGTYRFTIK